MWSAIKAYRNAKIPENYFRAEVLLLRYCGIELIHDETFRYKIYSYISMTFWIYLYTLVEVYEFYPAWNTDIDNFTNVFMNSVTHVNGAFKLGIIFLARDKFKRMIKIMHDEPFKPDLSRGGPEESTLMRDCVRTTERMFIFYTSCVSSVYLTKTCESILLFILKPQDEWQMTFMPISIVNTTYQPMFTIGFIYQHACVIAFVVFGIPADILLISIIAHLTCQFKILRLVLKNAKIRAIALKESPEGRNKSLGECYGIVMRNTVKHHLQILDLANEIEDSCSTIMLFVVLLSTMQLCFLLFQASLVPMGSMNFVVCLVYFFAVAIQVLQFCYFADEATSESVKVMDGVMEMDWAGAPISVQKSMILIMARSFRPIHFTAGKFVILSLPAFMTLIRASFSYFTVLKQVKGGD